MRNTGTSEQLFFRLPPVENVLKSAGKTLEKDKQIFSLSITTET